MGKRARWNPDRAWVKTEVRGILKAAGVKSAAT